MIPVYEPWLTEDERRTLMEAFDSGWISSKGEWVDRFEQAFAEYLGVQHAVACSSGTAALHLALLALGIGPGDTVAVPSLTFVATANAVTYTGATPVVCDVDANTWNLLPSSIDRAAAAPPRVVLPVHLYGNPCDMARLVQYARATNAYLVEDAAEALGATYRDRPVGTSGDIGVFSFFGNKTITTGEGGMVVTNNEIYAERARLFRGQGQTQTYVHDVVGYNYRMTNLQAAIGFSQLQRIDEILREKKRVYQHYVSRLWGTRCCLQEVPACGRHGHWMFAVRVPDRDAVRDRLSRAAIDHRPFFYPLDTLRPYLGRGNCQTARDVHNQGVVLPSSPLLTNEQIDRVCDVVLDREHVRKAV